MLYLLGKLKAVFFSLLGSPNKTLAVQHNKRFKKNIFNKNFHKLYPSENTR